MGRRVCDGLHADTPVRQALEARAVTEPRAPLTEAVVQSRRESWTGGQPHQTISGSRESHEEMTGDAGRDAGEGGGGTRYGNAKRAF